MLKTNKTNGFITSVENLLTGEIVNLDNFNHSIKSVSVNNFFEDIIPELENNVKPFIQDLVNHLNEYRDYIHKGFSDDLNGHFKKYGSNISTDSYGEMLQATGKYTGIHFKDIYDDPSGSLKDNIIDDYLLFNEHWEEVVQACYAQKASEEAIVKHQEEFSKIVNSFSSDKIGEINKDIANVQHKLEIENLQKELNTTDYDTYHQITDAIAKDEIKLEELIKAKISLSQQISSFENKAEELNKLAKSNNMSGLGELLDTHNLGFEKISGGFSNQGVYQNDTFTIIARDIKYADKIDQLTPKLHEAAKAGISVGEIIGKVIDDESQLVYELQTSVSGKNIADSSEYLQATDEQVLKLYKDLEKLNQLGLYIDIGGDNIMYNPKSGFSFIDLAHHLTEYNKDYVAANPQDVISKYFANLNTDFANRLQNISSSDIQQVTEDVKELLATYRQLSDEIGKKKLLKLDYSSEEAELKNLQTQLETLGYTLDENTNKWIENTNTIHEKSNFDKLFDNDTLNSINNFDKLNMSDLTNLYDKLNDVWRKMKNDGNDTSDEFEKLSIIIDQISYKLDSMNDAIMDDDDLPFNIPDKVVNKAEEIERIFKNINANIDVSKNLDKLTDIYKEAILHPGQESNDIMGNILDHLIYSDVVWDNAQNKYILLEKQINNVSEAVDKMQEKVSKFSSMDDILPKHIQSGLINKIESFNLESLTNIKDSLNQYINKLSKEVYDDDIKSSKKLLDEVTAYYFVVEQQIKKITNEVKNNSIDDSIDTTTNNIRDSISELSEAEKHLAQSGDLGFINEKSSEVILDDEINNIKELVSIIQNSKLSTKDFFEGLINSSIELDENLKVLLQKLNLLKNNKIDTSKLISNGSQNFDEFYNKLDKNIQNNINKLEQGFQIIKDKIAEFGNFNLKKSTDKEGLSKWVDQYIKYQEAGGQRSISDLTDNQKALAKITAEYEKQIALKKEQIQIEQQEKQINIQDESKQIQQEAQDFMDVSETAEKASVSKEEFVTANQEVLKSIIDSLKGLDNEGKAFDNLNKLLNNVGSDKGENKVKKLKVAIQNIYDLLNQNVDDNSLVRALENLANQGTSLENLATVLKASKKELLSAQQTLGNINSDELDDLLNNHSQEIIAKARQELLNLGGENSQFINISNLTKTKDGFIEIVGLICTANDQLQEFTLHTKDGINMQNVGMSENTARIAKQMKIYAQVQDYFDKMQAKGEQIANTGFFDKNAEPELWEMLIAYAKEYYQELGNIQSITYQTRQDTPGSPLYRSFSINGENAHVTLGPKGETVASNQELINVEKLTNKINKLSNTTKEYYSLLDKKVSVGLNDIESQRLEEIEQEYLKIISLVNQYKSSLENTTNIDEVFVSKADKMVQTYNDAQSKYVDKVSKSLSDALNNPLNKELEFSPSFIKSLEGAIDKVEELKEIINKHGSSNTPWSEDEIALVQKLRAEIDETNKSIKDNINILAKSSGIDKLLSKINNDLNDNSAMPLNIKKQYYELRDTIDSIRNSTEGLNKVDLNNLTRQFMTLHEQMLRTGQTGKSIIDQFKKAVTSQSVQFLARYFSFQDIVRYSREAFNAIYSLDTALVDLKKTTTMSNSELNEFYMSSNNIAKSMGVTTQEIIQQAADWSRLNKIGLLCGNT